MTIFTRPAIRSRSVIHYIKRGIWTFRKSLSCVQVNVYTCVVAKVVTWLLKCNYHLVAILATIKGALFKRCPYREAQL